MALLQPYNAPPDLHGPWVPVVHDNAQHAEDARRVIFRGLVELVYAAPPPTWPVLDLVIAYGSQSLLDGFRLAGSPLSVNA